MRSHVGPRGLGLLVGIGLVGAALAGCGDDDDSNDGGAGTGGDPAGQVSWCQVRQVLAAKCQRCHVPERLNGAPFALVEFQDTQVTEAGIVRWERMRNMVEQRLMPPAEPALEPPAEPLTEAERTLLLTWFDEGARAVGGTSCD